MIRSTFTRIEGALPEGADSELAQELSRIGVLGAEIGQSDGGLIGVGVWIQADDEGLAARVEAVLESLGAPTIRRETISDRDWSSRWRQELRAFAVGSSWWIDPHPDREAPAPVGRHRIAIEPRGAFGSGTHESTQLVLMEIESMACRQKRVLDVGTGSGILAVAACRLGARRVVAVDIDSIAAWEARHTASSQSRPCRIDVVAGGMHCLGTGAFDLVLCNMITGKFTPLLGEIRRLLAPDGRVVFSGILESERSSVKSLLRDVGLPVEGGSELRGWVSVLASRREIDE